MMKRMTRAILFILLKYCARFLVAGFTILTQKCICFPTVVMIDDTLSDVRC